MLIRNVLCLAPFILLPACTTTKVEEYSIQFPEETKETTVLDVKLSQLQKLAKEYPKRSDLHYQMAGIYYQREDYRSTVKCIQRAIEIDPQEMKYHFHLGRVYLKMRELDDAEKEFRRSLELMPQDRYTGPHGALGYVLCQKGKWVEAKAEFEACKRIDPSDPTPYFYLGCIYDVLKDEEQAVANLKQYIAMGGKGFRPKAFKILSTYGVPMPEEGPVEEEGETASGEGAGEDSMGFAASPQGQDSQERATFRAPSGGR